MRVHLQAGERLGRRYLLGELLGSGGSARVYRALDERLGVAVAIKVLASVHPDGQRRLAQEAAVQAGLRHPNVVPVTDLLEVDGRAAIVMELVEGPALDALFPLAPDEAEALFRGIVEGVRAAHRSGLVHRDLKPANVLVARTGDQLVPKVADFGLAKIVDAPHGQTRTGAVMGTPRYMSPEQIRDTKDVDARADVFSLGVLLYEMLAGRPAFEHPDTLVLFNRIARGEHEPIPPHVPARLAEVIHKCLAPDRDDRLQDADAILALLGPPSPVRWSAGTLERVGTASRPPSTFPPSSATWSESVVQPDPPPAPPATVAPTRRRRPWLLAVPAVALVAGALWLVTPGEPAGFGVDGPPAIAETAEVRQLVDQAWRELEEGEIARARGHVDDALRAGATDPSVHLLAAVLAFGGGDVAAFDRFVADGTERARGEGPVPDLLRALAEHRGADELALGPSLRAHLARWPEDRLAWIVLAMTMATGAEPPDLEVLERVATARPRAGGGWTWMVGALRSAGRLDEARAAGARGLERAPRSAPLYAELAITELLRHQPELALEHAYAALRIDPGWWPARLHGATAATNLGRADDFERLVAPMRGEEVPPADGRRFAAWVSRGVGNVGQLRQSAEWASIAVNAAVADDAQETLLQVHTYQVELALQRWMADDAELRVRLQRLDAAAADPSVPAALRQGAGQMSVLAHGILAARSGDEAEARRAQRRLSPEAAAHVEAELGGTADGCDALVVRATTASDAGRHDEAAALAQRALDTCPGTSSLPFGLALAVLELSGRPGRIEDRWPLPDADLPVMRRLAAVRAE